MSHILLKKTKNNLKHFITDTKYPDNKYQDKLVILKQVVESSLKSALSNIGVYNLVEKINKSSKHLKPNFSRSYNLHDFCIIHSSSYPNHEIYLDSGEEKVPISIWSVSVNTDWVYPDIDYLNKYLDTNYTKWSDIIPESDIVSIVNLFTDALDYLSKKSNCLNKYYGDSFGEFLSGINTEEDLMIRYPEIYEYYLEFKKAYPGDTKNIIRSGREVKEVLEEYRNYLTLVEEKEEEEEVGN